MVLVVLCFLFQKIPQNPPNPPRFDFKFDHRSLVFETYGFLFWNFNVVVVGVVIHCRSCGGSRNCAVASLVVRWLSHHQNGSASALALTFPYFAADGEFSPPPNS